MKKLYKKIICSFLLVFSCSLAFVTNLHAQGNTWTLMSPCLGAPRYAAVSFSIGNKGYLGTGVDEVAINTDFWEYDQPTDSWTQKADFAGGARYSAVGFSIGNKGYVGTGYDDLLYKNDFWEYNPSSNTWTQKANLPGVPRLGAVAFPIGTKGYIGTGYNGTEYINDFWEWNQTSDVWVQKANSDNDGRAGAVGFSMGAKGYIATGKSGTIIKDDLLEWDQVSNTWTPKTSLPARPRSAAITFVLGSKAFISTGYETESLIDTWEWNQINDTWTSRADFGGTARQTAVGFAINGKGYLATGTDCYVYLNDLWEYNPICNALSSFNASSTSVCENTVVNFTNTSTGATSYKWKNNGVTFATSANTSITFSTAGTYTIQLNVSDGTCSDSSSQTITVKELPVANAGDDATICSGASVQLNASGGNSYNWSPTTGLNDPTIANPIASPAATTNYTVTVTGANGCTDDDIIVVNVTSILIANAGPDTSICEGSSVMLIASTGTSYLWEPSTGLSCTDCQNPIASPAVTTNYTVTITSGSCTPVSDMVTVSVNALPTANAGADLTTCNGNFTQLEATGGESYSWIPADDLDDATIANPIANPDTTTEYIVTVTGTNGCKASDAIILTVTSVLTAKAGADTAICIGDTITLNASGGGEYSWSPITGLSCTDCPNPKAYPLNSTEYELTVTSGSCAPASDTVKILVNPLPNANAGPGDTICDGNYTFLYASGGDTYEWSPVTGLGNPKIDNPVAFPSSTTTYVVTVTDSNGCVSTSSATITVNTCTGVASTIENQDVYVFPNPATNEINIQINNTGVKELNLRITSIQGQLVYTNTIGNVAGNHNHKIDISTLSRGVYFMSINTDEKISIHKLILQ